MKAGSRAAAGGLPIAEMKRWYLAGDSNQTIGQRVSLHQGTVRRVLIEAGVTMRTRPEQVALNDARTGVRVPSRDELVAGYIEEGLTSAELAVRFGISETRIQSMLVRHGVERRRGGIRAARAEAERAARRPPQLIEEIVSLYGSGLSRKATAARVGVHRVVVDDVLRRAGVEFRDRRKLPPLNEWVDRYVDGGETTAEIAATYAASPEAVLRALKLGGIERRRATARMPPLSDADVVACYVDERLSIGATAKRLGVSRPRVRAAVGRLGVLRTAFDPSTLDRKRFVRRYDAGATIAELGQEFELTEHEVGVAIRYLELPRRLQVTHRPLQISDRQLAALVAAGHSDTDIATRYRVAVWAVVRRRRRSRLLRPPPNKVRPPLTRAQLKRQLAARTRADIATAHNVGLATVTRWCAHYGLDVVGPRPPSGGGHAVELDPTELRRLYVDEQWSARQIGDHLGVDGAIVTFALHSHRIPVRRGGNGAQADAVVLLDTLYADPAVIAVLERHRIPLRRRAGRLSRRFPRPAPLELGLVDDLYRDLGLTTTHISLLTGHSATNVCEVLRRHGISTRPSNRSPWYERTFL